MWCAFVVVGGSLRPAGSDPKLFAKKILFWKLVFPWVDFGHSVAHGKHSAIRRCVQAPKKQGRNLLSPWRHWAPFVRPLKGLGIKIDVWENAVVYASTRDWSNLYGAIRSEPETGAQSSCSPFWEHSRCLSSACIVVGAVTVTPAKNFVSPLSESSPSPHKHLKKKKSVSPHDSQFIQANVRQPFQVPLDSAFDRLKMNSSRPSARYHSRWRSWCWQVGWLAQTTLYQVSQAQTAGWVKWNKKKKFVACSWTSWCSQATFLMLSDYLGSGCQKTCLDHCWARHVAFDFIMCLTLSPVCDLLTITVRDKPAAWLVTVM